VRHYKSDAACTDGARTFLPCKMIVSLQDGGKKLPIYEVPKDRPKPLDIEKYKNLPVSNFVSSLMRYGTTPGERNRDCFKAALEMFRKNFDESLVRKTIFNSIPTSADFTDREKDTIVRSALSYRDKVSS